MNSEKKNCQQNWFVKHFDVASSNCSTEENTTPHSHNVPRVLYIPRLVSPSPGLMTWQEISRPTFVSALNYSDFNNQSREM